MEGAGEETGQMGEAQLTLLEGVVGPRSLCPALNLPGPYPSLCVSVSSPKQDSKSLKATPRPLISWYPGLWVRAEAGQPPCTVLVGQEPQGAFPGASTLEPHVVVSSQVGPPGSRMEGAAHHGGSCTQGCPASSGQIPGRGRGGVLAGPGYP